MIREIVRKTSLPLYFVLDTIRYKRGQRKMMAYSLKDRRYS